MSENYKCISDYNYTDEEVAERNDGTEMVELTGYLDPATYIAQMINAGIALDQIRSGLYEYDYDGDDDDVDPVIDPLRAPWTDPADVDQFAMGLERSVVNNKAAADRAAANQVDNAKSSDHEQNYPPVTPPIGANPPLRQTNSSSGDQS